MQKAGLSGLWPGRREPDAALPVEHRVVVVGLAVPDVLLAPIGRGPQDLDRAGVAGPERQRHVGRGRQHEVRRDVLHRIEDRHVVAGMLALPVQRPVGVDGRIAPVAGDQVVQILLVVVPVAQRDDDVALDALRPRRLGNRQLALRDALGPVAEILERHAAELTGGDGDHVLAGLSGLDAAHPGFFVRLDRVHVELRNRAGRELAELMAADAAVVLHAVEIVGDLDVVRRVLAAEDLGLRDLHHRVPVDRRVVLRGFRLVRRRHRRQIELLAGLALHLRRVDEAVAAHPDVVIGFRQIGDHVAALVVGDDDLDVAHRQIARFRDHPDAGLRAAGAAHDAADVIVVDRHLLRAHGRGERDCGRKGRCNTELSLENPHLSLPMFSAAVRGRSSIEGEFSPVPRWQAMTVRAVPTARTVGGRVRPPSSPGPASIGRARRARSFAPGARTRVARRRRSPTCPTRPFAARAAAHGRRRR